MSRFLSCRTHWRAWRTGVPRSLALLSVCVLAVMASACGTSGPSTPGATPPTASPTPTSATVPFHVTSVDLAVSPASNAGTVCGSPATFTYTATFHIPSNTPGGVIQFAYTLNNGRSQTPASVSVGAGQTSESFTFVSSGTLLADHTYPGSAIVMVTSPNAVISPAVLPSSSCAVRGPFEVTAVTMTVSPTSMSGMACGTSVTVIYTATFHLAPNGPGGVIQFEYTINNGRGSQLASVTAAPGQTDVTYQVQWSGALPADHTYPGLGGVIVQSPDAITSSLVGPSGVCS